MGLSQSLYKKAKKIIPGGTQLFSKRPELFLPDLWPAYYQKAKGCLIWDLDGKVYADMSSMGIGACILGYADREVDHAVTRVIEEGVMTTLNPPEEIELAEVLLKLHPWAKMCRFGRSGGEAMAIAIRIARAKTGKDIVLFCGYHGWHDWYLAANLGDKKSLDGHLLPGLNPLGVPRALKGTILPFNFNDREGFLKLVARYKGKIGAVVMEPVRNQYPEEDFLKTIRAVTKDLQVPLIFDEITSAWRMTLGGAHLLFGINPDIAVFAKAMSNGFAMAAIIGTKEVMSVAQDTFISSTYWTERIGPAAALATIKKLKEKNVSRHLIDTGRAVQEGWRKLALKHHLNIEISGTLPLGHFTFKCAKPQVLKTLFTQLMLAKGFLATNAFYASFSHSSKQLNAYLAVVDKSFYSLAKAIASGKPERQLRAGVCQSSFKRIA